jgi:eukaryotic-like serine/threonine-protein kinase
MDLATGGSLEETIRSRTVTIEVSIRWTVEACEVMQHMHERGIVHCDLKPANLLLGDRSQILVADFGLACSVVEQRTADRQIAGTAPFMAPEQVSSYWGPLSARTDVYGLGAVLYTLLTGVPPHEGTSNADVLARVASGVAITPPRMRRPELSIELNDACMRSLAKQPDDRFASARAFAEELRQIPGSGTAHGA